MIDTKTEKDLYTKILEITIKIKDHYPELSSFIEEMPATIPSEKDAELTEKNLKFYYESLLLILEKYKQEHPERNEEGDLNWFEETRSVI